VSIFGIGTAFLLNAVTFVPVVLAVVLARPRQVMAPSATERIRNAMAEGFRYTWQRSALRRAVLTGLAVSAMGQTVTALAAGVSGDIYGHEGANGAAGLVAALGAGSLLSGLYILGRGDRLLRSRTAMFGIAVYVLGIMLIPMSTNYQVGMIAYFVCGLAHIPIATSLNTFVQGAVPDEIRGRVLSFYLLGVMIGMPTGALLLGRLGDVIGLRETLVLDALAFAGFFVFVAIRFHRLRFVDQDSLDEVDAAPVKLALS
jgi:MFS family permease